MEDNEKGKNLRIEAEETLKVMTLDLGLQNPETFEPVFDYGVHMLEVSGIEPWRIKTEALILQKKIQDADSFIQKVMSKAPAFEIYNTIIDEIVLKFTEQLNLDEIQRKAISVVVNAIIHNSLDKKFSEVVEYQIMGRAAAIIALKLAGLDQSDGENKENQWTSK
ncbi:MAG: hypothetical protein MUP55_00045 [Candidatus Aenigmarchaeota archaeon]|nr:hypothetical protein [Candidatus Aenigmarchaeota archaeon]